MSNMKALIEKAQNDPNSLTEEEVQQVVAGMAELGAAINAATQVIITALQPIATFLKEWANKERDRKEIQP